MMGEAAIFIAFILSLIGGLLYVCANTGPQQSLGGGIVIAGFIIATAGGLLWIVGL